MQKAAVQRSIGDLERESRETVRNAMALHPEIPAANLLEHVIELAEPDFLAQLDPLLRAKHFLQVIRAERIKDRRKHQEESWLSPQIRNAVLLLPLRVPIGGDETVSRDDLEYRHIRLYRKFLMKQRRERHQKDAKNARIAAIDQIQKSWPRAKKRPLVMTIREVDLFKARKAGLAE